MEIHDSLVPDWMKAIEAEDALKAAQQEAADQRAVARGFQIAAESPAWWEALLEQLTLGIAALSRIKLQGAIVDHPKLSSELSVRVSVWNPEDAMQQLWADFFYQPQSSEIRCSVLNGGVSNFTFCIQRSGKLGIFGQDGVILDSAKEMANSILKRLVTLVRRLH